MRMRCRDAFDRFTRSRRVDQHRLEMRRVGLSSRGIDRHERTLGKVFAGRVPILIERENQAAIDEVLNGDFFGCCQTLRAGRRDDVVLRGEKGYAAIDDNDFVARAVGEAERIDAYVTLLAAEDLDGAREWLPASQALDDVRVAR